MILFGNAGSGNCYKVRLALSISGQSYRYVDLDSLHGETRQPAFLKLNPWGKIPALQLDDGTVLTESNAIVWYLAKGSALWPVDALEQQSVMSWLFWEQYSHEPKLAVARSWTLLGKDKEQPERFGRLVEQSASVLAYMEARLGESRALAGDQLSIADLCLFAYTHKAEDIGLSFDQYPRLSAWIERIRHQDWWMPITEYPESISLKLALSL